MATATHKPASEFEIQDYLGSADHDRTYNPFANLSVFVAGLAQPGSTVKNLDKCTIYTVSPASQIVFPLEGEVKFDVEKKSFREGMEPVYTINIKPSAMDMSKSFSSLETALTKALSKMKLEAKPVTKIIEPEYNSMSFIQRDVWAPGSRALKPLLRSHLGAPIEITDLKERTKIRMVVKCESLMTYDDADGNLVGKINFRPTLIQIVEEFAPPDWLTAQCTRGATPVKPGKKTSKKRAVGSVSKPKAPRKPAAKKPKKESEAVQHVRESKKEDEEEEEEEEEGEEVEE